MGPWVKKRLPDGSALLIGGAATPEFVRQALAAAQSLGEKDWHLIHSKTSKDVHRVVTVSAARHTAALKKLRQSHIITRNANIVALSKTFIAFAEAAAKVAGIVGKGGIVSEVELVRVLAHALGQYPHMDSFFGAWVYILCLHDGAPPTHLKKYCYHDWPMNMRTGKAPRDWDKLGSEDPWAWKAGDILMFKSNRIHGGPPNLGNDNRYIFFGSSLFYNAPVETYSDTVVVTEPVFYGVGPSTPTAHHQHVHHLPPGCTHMHTVSHNHTHHRSALPDRQRTLLCLRSSPSVRTWYL